MIFAALALNCDRHWHGKGGFTGNWFYIYFTRIFFNYFSNYIQSSAAAFTRRLCRKERLKYSRQNFPGNSLASISSADEYARIFSPLLLKLHNCPFPQSDCESNLSALDLVHLDSQAIGEVGLDRCWHLRVRVLVGCDRYLKWFQSLLSS